MSADPDLRQAKTALRRHRLEIRTARPEEDRAAAAVDLRDQVVSLPQLSRATRVTCYVAMSEEPGTAPLLDALVERDITVLLPVVGSGPDLDWAPYAPGTLRESTFGILEPTTPALGPEAIATASVVLLPGLVGDREGNRLGRGRGYYDRALARVGQDTSRILLLYDDEVLTAVPADRLDQRVDLLVTPSRIITTTRRTTSSAPPD